MLTISGKQLTNQNKEQFLRKDNKHAYCTEKEYARAETADTVIQ